MKPGRILIAGGYGTVGRIIATVLADTFPGQVIVAGRNRRKAEELAAATGHKVLPMAFDVTSATLNTSFANSESAAQVAEQLVTTDFPSGVFHIEQLFEPLVFIEQLRATVVASMSSTPDAVYAPPAVYATRRGSDPAACTH